VARHEGDHSVPSLANVKKERSSTPTPFVFMVWTGANSPFYTSLNSPCFYDEEKRGIFSVPKRIL
jgi:hypothetical protein